MTNRYIQQYPARIQQPKPQRSRRREATLEKSLEQRDRSVLMLGIILIVCALLLMWNVGSLCQNAKNEGMSIAVANAKVEANAQAYDKGYADAVWDYEHGEKTVSSAG